MDWFRIILKLLIWQIFFFYTNDKTNPEPYNRLYITDHLAMSVLL